MAPGSEEGEGEAVDWTGPPMFPLAPAAKAALSKASIDTLIVMDSPRHYEGSMCQKIVESFRSTREECAGRCMVMLMHDSW